MATPKKKPGAKASVGRPAAKVDDDMIARVEDFAANGLKIEEMGPCLAMGSSTFFKLKAENVELQEAINRGKSRGASETAGELMKLVKAGNLSAIIWYEKTRCGRSERIDVNNTGSIAHKHEGVPRGLGILRELKGFGQDRGDEDSLPN